MGGRIIQSDCLALPLGDDSVDLVFGSPPYEDARTYGIGFNLRGQDWVDWAVPRFAECLRVCRGLVAWVVEGRTRKYSYSGTPQRLAVSLMDKGYVQRKPAIYLRTGIPGSGGPDWMKNRWEHVLCFTRKQGRLPWSDNTAMGSSPKYGPGGPTSNRKKDGTRVGSAPNGVKGGDLAPFREYKPPKLANPGNIIVVDCGASGGSHLGSKIAHEHPAPFPEFLAEFFVRSFCPPGGTVLDPFSGSGTTSKVAEVHGRNWIAVDIDEASCNLTQRRLESETDWRQPVEAAA